MATNTKCTANPSQLLSPIGRVSKNLGAMKQRTNWAGRTTHDYNVNQDLACWNAISLSHEGPSGGANGVQPAHLHRECSSGKDSGTPALTTLRKATLCEVPSWRVWLTWGNKSQFFHSRRE
jgi:hypothetical protein